MNCVDQLCLKCGLCCNGVLFADVELRASDDPRLLKKLGLPLFKKTAKKQAFPQSCTCFDGQLCQIYGDRPKRCRQFACGLLKRVEAEELKPAAALRQIAMAKKQFDKVDKLLCAMGQGDATIALSERFSNAMSAPMNLANKANTDNHGELMLAMNALMERLHQDFLA